MLPSPLATAGFMSVMHHACHFVGMKHSVTAPFLATLILFAPSFVLLGLVRFVVAVPRPDGWSSITPTVRTAAGHGLRFGC